MPEVSLRFYEELNDFLPPARKKQEFTVGVRERNSVKDLIESLGVPHTEVDLILVNGQSVGFGYLLSGGERISVYPVFEALDIGGVTRLRPEPLRQVRFVLDTHLGRLVRYLRLLGFDSLYDNASGDRELAARSAKERRILLTRDLGLLKRKQVTHGYFVRHTRPLEQAREVVRRFDLARLARPFTLCIHCNGRLEPAEPAAVKGSVPPRVAGEFDRFSRCGDCGRVYWAGSHYDRLQRILDDLINGRV